MAHSNKNWIDKLLRHELVFFILKIPLKLTRVTNNLLFTGP